MIKFKINGYFQRQEAEGIAALVRAETADAVTVRATFVEMPDEKVITDAFRQGLADEIAYARGDRGRLNALHSVRRHFEEAMGES